MATATASNNEDFTSTIASAITSAPTSDRLNEWACLFILSAIVLTAHETDDEAKFASVTAFTSISLTLSFVATVAHVGKISSLSVLFVGTVIESIFSLFVVAIWAALLPIIMNPANGLAQMYVGKSEGDVADFQATISNANLYFLSWGAGICALSVLATTIRERCGGVGGMGALYTSKWYLLLVASVIVIIESTIFKKQVCGLENGTEDYTCRRNTYGLVTGYIGLIISLVISISSTFGKDSSLITTVASFIMAVLSTFCATLLTFDKGPATYVGNHYFSAWAGFFLSFAIFGGMVKEYLGVGAGKTADAVVIDPENEKFDEA